MGRIVPRLPPAQLTPLLAAYDSAVAAKRRWTLGGATLVVVLAVLSGWIGQVDLAKFWTGLPRFGSYFYDILPRLRLASLAADLEEWLWNLDGWLALLWDTLLIAYSERQPGRSPRLPVLPGIDQCRALEETVLRRPSYARVCRTVPEIVFALMFVYALGFGPMPGVIAIAIHTTGALGKQFSEGGRECEYATG